MDEAHTTVENYDFFHPEFKDSVAAINQLITINKINNPYTSISTLNMSDTFCIPKQKLFNKLIGRFPDIVKWGPIDQRNVGIFNHVTGDPVHAILKQWTAHVEEDPDMQSLLYSNLAMACDDSLIPRLEKATSKFPREIRLAAARNEFILFMGKAGLIMKAYLMECFCAEDEFNEYNLPFIWCMPCTSAENCDVSCKRCRKCYRFRCPCQIVRAVSRPGARISVLHDSSWSRGRGVRTFSNPCSVNINEGVLWVSSSFQQQKYGTVNRQYLKASFPPPPL